jgi:hypothetical protein
MSCWEFVKLQEHKEQQQRRRGALKLSAPPLSIVFPKGG